MQYISKSKQWKIGNKWDAEDLYDIIKKEYGDAKTFLHEFGRTSQMTREY